MKPKLVTSNPRPIDRPGFDDDVDGGSASAAGDMDPRQVVEQIAEG